MLPAKGAVQIGLFDRVVEKGSVLEAGENHYDSSLHAGSPTTEYVCCATCIERTDGSGALLDLSFPCRSKE